MPEIEKTCVCGAVFRTTDEQESLCPTCRQGVDRAFDTAFRRFRRES